MFENARTPFVVALAGTVFGLLNPLVAQAQSWIKLNGGHYIDAGEPLLSWPIAFTSLRQPDGDLLYFFNSSRLGQVMGRLSLIPGVRYTGDLWDGAGWSHAPDTVPTAINHSWARWPRGI